VRAVVYDNIDDVLLAANEAVRYRFSRLVISHVWDELRAHERPTWSSFYDLVVVAERRMT
jgi:hypothetical protein